MDTRRLSYFVQIVDSGSITRAAAAIGVAQPALSQQVAVLENELKVKLLERSATGVRPTEAGRTLYARAHAILRQIDELKTDIDVADKEPAGSVAIGLTPSLALPVAVPLIERTRKLYPRIHLQLAENGANALADQLTRGQLDMAVLPFRLTSDGIGNEDLFEENIYVISSTRTPAPGRTLAKLAKLDWIVTNSPNTIRGLLVGVFAQSGLEPNIAIEINSLSATLYAVERGLGVTLTSKAAVAEALERGTVRITQPGPTPITRTIHLALRHTPAPTRAASAVAALVRAIARGPMA